MTGPPLAFHWPDIRMHLLVGETWACPRVLKDTQPAVLSVGQIQAPPTNSDLWTLHRLAAKRGVLRTWVRGSAGA